MSRLRTRRLGIGFETLEQRTVLAGNVTAAVSLAIADEVGFLDITGDAAANSIAIYAGDLPFQVVVAGARDAAGNPTLVNGQNRVTFEGVTKGLRIVMNDGNDKLVLTKLNVGSTPSVTADLGAQADTMILRGNVPATPDLTLNDAAPIPYAALSLDELHVLGRGGNDALRMFNTNLGDNQASPGVSFRGGADNDTVQTDGLMPSGFPTTGFHSPVLFDMGSGADFVNLAHTGFESPYTLTVFDPLVTGDAALTSRVKMFQCQAGRVELRLSGTDADVSLTGADQSFLKFGANSLLLEAGSGSQIVMNFAVVSTASIRTGAGQDLVQINNSRFNTQLAVQLGGDDDELVLGTTTSGKTYLDGGAGTDTYTDQGGNSLGTLTRINFEP